MKAVFLTAWAIPAAVFSQVQDSAREPAPAHVPTMSVLVSAGVESLSNNTPDWREQSVQLEARPARGRSWVAGATRTRRFGLEDLQFNGVYADRLTPSLAATVEGNFSTTHRVLPRCALGAQLHHEFRPAWIAHVGLKTTSYDTVRANQGLVAVEHYFGSFSLLAGWRPTRAFGQTHSAAELRGAYYYGDDSSVALLVTSGRELVSLGTTLVQARVRAVALIGRHALNERWAVTYGASNVEQGSLYTRRGVNVGLRHTF